MLPGAQPPVDMSESPEVMHLAQRMQRQTLEDSYAQQQQQQQQAPQQLPQPNHVDMVRESSRQPLMSGFADNRMQPSNAVPRNQDRQAHAQQQVQGVDNGNISAMPPNDIPRDAQRFEQGPPKDTAEHSAAPNENLVGDADGWNFDDLPVIETTTAQRPDMDVFPDASLVSSKSPPRSGPGSHRRKSSGARRRSEGKPDVRELAGQKSEPTNFKVRFALRGHLDVVRSVIFTGGGSPSEPEICTAGDDGTIKRWTIPSSYGSFGPNSNAGNDLDVTSYFTHRGHSGVVTCLTACSPSQDFSNGGRALGDGWVFSGGQDASIKVWERGRVDPKASLDGHTDAVWALNVLPATVGSIFGEKAAHYGGADRILLVSGAADGRILVWAVSAPPQLSSPPTASRGARGGSRRANSISSGSNFPISPQPNTSSATPFHYTLVHNIMGKEDISPTCISPLSLAGINFVVSFTDASVRVYDTRTGEEIVGMASLETYDGTRATGVNSVVATTVGFDGTADLDPSRAMAEEETVHGATGSSNGVEGVVISGYEDRYIRFFDANSGKLHSHFHAYTLLTILFAGQCTYTMLAHPSAISSLSLSPDGLELVSAGHDASLRFWSLEKRSCTQEITSHRLMRGEGVCSVIWSKDGRWVVSGGGDGVVKVFAR